MQYAEVDVSGRLALISLELTGWGATYKDLFDQTDASGAGLWRAYSHNGFNNLLQQADEARYKSRRRFAEIVRDKVREGGRGENDKGMLDMEYVSHAGTIWEQTHRDIWAPKSGFWVPTSDGVFYEGTLIPFETVQGKQEAMKRLDAGGIPPEQASRFIRFEHYVNSILVARGSGQCWEGDGMFDVYANKLPLFRGHDWVASRPAYGKPKIVMKVAEPAAPM